MALKIKNCFRIKIYFCFFPLKMLRDMPLDFGHITIQCVNIFQVFNGNANLCWQASNVMCVEVLKRFAHNVGKKIKLDDTFMKMTKEFVFHNIHTICKFTVNTNICFSIIFFFLI